MRIVLIGPTKPFRGGIAHSNEMLLENLSKKHEVKAISFSRLFPKILYPGKFQTENGRNSGTLDSISPFSWEEHRKEIERFSPDSVLFQWWTTFLTPCYTYLAAGAAGRKIAICQNVFPHKEGKATGIKRAIDNALTKVFFSKMDKLVAMSHSDQRELRALFPKKNSGIYLEPVYGLEGIKKGAIKRSEAKKALGLQGKNVLLFFGFVRPYKGLQYLLQAMPKILQKSNAHLLIVGEFWGDKARYLESLDTLDIGKHVTIIDRYVPDEEVPKYFVAADLLVLPYTSISESGVIRMAFNFNTPILSTNVGGNPDHIHDGVNGFLVNPHNADEIAEKAVEFFEKSMYQRLSKGMSEVKKELEWSEEKEKAVLG